MKKAQVLKTVGEMRSLLKNLESLEAELKSVTHLTERLEWLPV